MVSQLSQVYISIFCTRYGKPVFGSIHRSMANLTDRPLNIGASETPRIFNTSQLSLPNNCVCVIVPEYFLSGLASCQWVSMSVVTYHAKNILTARLWASVDDNERSIVNTELCIRSPGRERLDVIRFHSGPRLVND